MQGNFGVTELFHTLIVMVTQISACVKIYGATEQRKNVHITLQLILKNLFNAIKENSVARISAGPQVPVGFCALNQGWACLDLLQVADA